MTRAPTVSCRFAAIVNVEEVNIAAIQALEIEVDELALAYARLDQATAELRIERVNEALAISTETAVQAQTELERQVTAAIQAELETRASILLAIEALAQPTTIDGQQFGATSHDVVQVVINGNLFSSRETADWLIEEIKDRIANQDVVIIQLTSRQAQELLPGD